MKEDNPEDNIPKDNIPKDEGDETIHEGYKLLEPKLPTSEEIIRKSILVLRRGYIAINDLVCILALDESYKESLLYAHWDELQISKRKNFPDDISAPEKRVGVWDALIERWTSKSIGGNRAGLKPIAGLLGYKFITDKDEFVEDKDDPDYVKLDELKAYLKNIEIPLPALLFQEYQEEQKAITSTVTDEEVTQKKKNENFFVREGDFWHIGFEGKEKTIKNVDGLFYISCLLANPEKSFPCKELYQVLSGKTPDKPMSENLIIDEGLSKSQSIQKVSDGKAIIDYKRKYLELQNDFKKAESEMEREEIEKEMEAILPHIKKKNFGDSNDKKAQNNILKSLYAAYKVIDKAGMSKLVTHLSKCIITDGKYGLFYNGSLKWQIIYN